MTKMTVLSINAIDNINVNYRKEKHFSSSFHLLTTVNGEVKELATVRLYTTESRSYCCVWVRLPGRFTSGSDFASGWGYDRNSASVYFALSKAGIEFDEKWGGKGESAIIEALEAIAKYLGHEYSYVLKAHA